MGNVFNITRQFWQGHELRPRHLGTLEADHRCHWSPGVDERDFGDVGDGPDVIRGRRVLGPEDGRHAQLQQLAGLPFSLEAERKSRHFESLDFEQIQLYDLGIQMLFDAKVKANFN